MIKKIILPIIILAGIGLLIFYSPFFNKIHNQKDISKQYIDDRPNDDEPYKESKTVKSEVSDEKKEIEVKYDQYVSANGFIGASDIAYFTRNGVLYHLVISTDTVTKIAEGVKKIEDDKDSLTAYKGDNFKVIKEDDYVDYVD